MNFSKIEKNLLKTVYREDTDSKESLPPLALNLEMDEGYYSPIYINSEDEYAKWMLQNRENISDIIKIGPNKAYIPVKEAEVLSIISNQCAESFLEKTPWGKPVLNRAEVIVLAQQLTAFALKPLGMNINYTEVDYEIVGYANKSKDLSSAVFSTMYFLIVNYILKGRCEIGPEYELIKNSLERLNQIYGSISKLPEKYNEERIKFQKVFVGVVENQLVDLLYKYIELSVSKVSNSGIKLNEENLVNLYEEVKILIWNICGNNLDLGDYYLLKDVINYVLYFEEAWKKLISVCCKDSNYRVIIERHLEKIKRKDIDEFILIELETAINYIKEKENTKEQTLNILSKGLKSTPAIVDAKYKQLISGFISKFEEIISDIANMKNVSQSFDYRYNMSYSNASRTRTIYMKNENNVKAGNRELFNTTLAFIQELGKWRLGEYTSKPININSNIGIDGTYELIKSNLIFNGYQKIDIDVYMDTNIVPNYIRYIEIKLEEPIVEVNSEDLTKFGLLWNR